jgi:hypothetical protein
MSVLSRFMAVYVLFLVAVTVAAQNVSTSAQAQVNPAGSNDAQATPPAIQADLLPVFALDLNFDPSWIDGADVPSKSARYSNNGVNDAFQKAWETLKPAGFKTIRFKVDLRDAHSATRLANLCLWAKVNNVTLIPVLEYSATGSHLTDFPAAFVSRLRAGDAQQFAAYSQVLYFQLGSAINVGGLHPEIKPGEAQKTLLLAIDSLRNAEVKALQGSDVPPSPIMVSASFDYELIQQGANVGAALDPSDEQKAHASLKQFLEPLAANANLDAVNVEWFPGSISPGDVDRFAILLRELETAVAGKQVLLTTGFSSAFNPADQQTQFLALATTNLWNFHLADGGDSSHFLGVVFEQGLKENKSDAAPPAGSGDPSQWNWAEKTSQLARMLSGGKSSAELKWWMSKVRGNMALLAPQSDASGGTDFVPLPAFQAFQQISTALAQARENIAATPAPGVSRGKKRGKKAAAYNDGMPAAPVTQVSGSASPSPYQQLLMTLVQQATTQLTTALITKATTPSRSKIWAQDPAAAAPDPATFAQPASAPDGAQAQFASAYTQNDAGTMPLQSPSATSDSAALSPSTAARSRAVRPAAQAAWSAGASTNPPAGTASPKPDASTSGMNAANTKGNQQGSSTGTASGQLASAPLVRSVRPAMSATGGSASTQSTSAQPPRAVYPIANNQPNQRAASAWPSAAPLPSPAARSVQPSPTAPSSAIAGRAQPSSTVAVNQPVRPGPAPARAPSAAAAGPAPAVVPTTTAQLVRPGPRSSSAPSNQPIAVTHMPAPALPNGAGSPGGGRLDLSVSAADIRITPTGTGQIAVTALIRNVGTLGTGAATVLFRASAAGRQVAASQPMAFNIAGSGVYQARWTTSVPPGQSLQLSVLVNASGDANPTNNQAVLVFSTPAAVASRR